MLYTHLLVLLLVAPVCPHVTSVDARQHHGAPKQHHVHRLLSIPEALLFTAFMVKVQKWQSESALNSLCVEESDSCHSVIHTWFSDVELYSDRLIQVAVEMVEVTGVQTSVIHRHIYHHMQKNKTNANVLIMSIEITVVYALKRPCQWFCVLFAETVNFWGGSIIHDSEHCFTIISSFVKIAWMQLSV